MDNYHQNPDWASQMRRVLQLRTVRFIKKCQKHLQRTLTLKKVSGWRPTTYQKEHSTTSVFGIL